jgi:hypothetical protein
VYIVEENPVVEIPQNHLTIVLDNHYTNIGYIDDIKLSIKNIGNGILIWSVSDLPEWLLIKSSIGTILHASIPVSALPPNGEGEIFLSYNSTVPFLDVMEKSSEKIVITTNDKDNPKVEVDINAHSDLGNSSLAVEEMNWRGANKINFGQTSTWQQYHFYENGDGFLVWKIDGCPEWLTIDESHGISFGSHSVNFSCNRTLLSSGENTAIIYLKTNDKNNPSYAITVTAQK